MARSTSPVLHFRQRLAAYPWRRVGVLAAVGLGLSLALVGYLFGVSDHFFGRLFSAFFVCFWLLAVTFLGIVPFIGWASGQWFGPGWRGSQPTTPKRRPAAEPAKAPARRSSTPLT